MNSDRYIRNTLEPFFEQLTDEERQYGYFQEDSSTLHATWNSMSALQGGFDDRIVASKITGS
jgi:hypothetical protein